MKQMTLEESFEQLDVLIDRLENGNVPIDEAFKLYKEGVKLVEGCNKQLDKVEKEMVVLGNAEVADE